MGSKLTSYNLHPPWTPCGKHFISETSTCPYLIHFLNFSFLAPVVSEIIWGPKFTLGALCSLDVFLAENFYTQSEYFNTSNGVFNFNFLAVPVSEIFGVSNLH